MIKYSRVKRIYFTGIGGAGMSGIAEVLHNMGFNISGSDIAENDTVKRLKKMGVNVYLGHNKDNIKNIETLVFSSAIKKDNVEVQEALKRKIPVITRAEMLAELMRMKFSIAVAGTHGKTTTTSMIACILNEAEKDPTFVVGGRLNIENSGAKLGKSDYLVAEADESDGSFLSLFPTISVITNIEDDHLDYYETQENLIEAFIKFGNRVPFYGSVVLNNECENSKKMVPFLNRKVITFGLSKESIVRAEKIKGSAFKVSFDLIIRNRNRGRVELNIGGFHNVFNALACIATSVEIGIDVPLIKQGLKRFYLPERRFQVLLYNKNYVVIDDYAHHPTEIKVTIETIRNGDFKRVIAVFQPHRFTRLKILMDEFVSSFGGVDKLVISKVYAANQEKIENVSGEILVEKIKDSGFKDVIYIEDSKSIIDYLKGEVKKGDAVIFLSAGDLTNASHQFAKIMKEYS